MRVRRPVRWALVLVGLAICWLAGAYVQEARARREAERESRRVTTTAPTTKQVPVSGHNPTTGSSSPTTTTVQTPQ